MDELKIAVSVCMITYNHDLYITQAIEGVLKQKTSFKIELIIGEDFSTDNTREVCLTFQKKYPDIIKLLLPDKNRGMQRNLIETMNAGQGKYLAFCEGDDYWTDSNKLQKQVDFLETHSEYGLCAHNTLIQDDFYKERNNILFSNFEFNAFRGKYKNDYTIEDTFLGNIFHFSSVVVRNKKIEIPSFAYNVPMFDQVLYPLWGQLGKIYVLDDVMSVYRNNLTSFTNTDDRFLNSVKLLENLIFVYFNLNVYFQGAYKSIIYPIMSRLYILSFFANKRSSRKKKALRSLFLAFRYNFKIAFVELIQKIKKMH